MSKRPTHLNEDTEKLYNQWVSGIAKRDLQPEVITVADIVNRFRNRYDRPRPFPYPLNMIVDQLGDLFVKCADFRRNLYDSMANPVVSENKNAIEGLKALNEKIDAMQKLIFSCSEDLNKIVEK